MEAKKPKIFITGVSGQLGTCLKELVTVGRGYYFQAEFNEAYQSLKHFEFVFADRTASEGATAFDLSDSNLAEVLSAINPSLIINPAAWTAVDLSESKVEETYAVNARSLEQIALWAKQKNVPVIHYSTDYVFDGSGNQKRKESDPTGPLQVYGASKLEGEKLLFSHHDRAVCLRTSWVVSHVGVNFIRTMLRLGSERDALKIVNDQIGAPTDAMLLAEVSLIIAAKLLSPVSNPFPYGIYHLSGSGETSWHGFAEEIFREARHRGYPLKVKSIEGIPSSDYPTPAKRPLNSRLDLTKIETSLGFKIPDWKKGLMRILGQLT